MTQRPLQSLLLTTAQIAVSEGSEVAKSPEADALMPVLRDLFIALTPEGDRDLTARQICIFLLVHTEQGPHTVRGMAAKLDIAKTGVTRVLDRMELLDLLKRRPDPEDRRSVLISRTLKGSAFFTSIKVSLPTDFELPSS